MFKLDGIIVWIGAILFLPAAAVSAQAARANIEQCDCTPDCIKSYISRFSVPGGEYSANEAERLSKHCGESAVAPLLQWVKDDAHAQQEGFALLCLGKIGTADCESALIEYVKKARIEPVDHGEYIDIQMALYGLGFIGSEVSIEFLRLLCLEEYWQNRADFTMLVPVKVVQGKEYREFTINTWRDSALAGIDTLEPERSIKEMERLRADKKCEVLYPSIDRALVSKKAALEAERLSESPRKHPTLLR